MNRTFKTVVGWWYWGLIFVTSVLLLYFFWLHHTILAIILAIVVIYEIEMLIHTQYIITSDEKLIVETGRFVKNFSMNVSQIESVTKVRSMVFWQPSLSFFRLEIKYNGKNKVAKIQISPQNEEAFINKLKKINPDIIIK